jgi:N,N'-diacetyllegionaminate synthase
MLSDPFIIAEAGVNHNGNVDLACRLIDAAREAGADAVKFQTFKTEKLVSPEAETADYQKQNLNCDESQFEMLKKLELSYPEFVQLKQYCDRVGIMFLSTPDEEESLDFLTERLNIPAIKVGSGEITNLPYLARIARKKLPVILSTGMADIYEVGEAVAVLQEQYPGGGLRRDNQFPPLTLLHCTTDYPALYEEVNLKALITLENTFQLPVGYSDHTMGCEVAVAAVALGASIIEKHFTLDRNLPGPDHKASLEPQELKRLVQAIRNTAKALGNGAKRPAPSETAVMNLVRKSLVAVKDLKKGELITESDIAIKRPGTGISPKYRDVVAGMRLTRNLAKDEPLGWNCFKE